MLTRTTTYISQMAQPVRNASHIQVRLYWDDVTFTELQDEDIISFSDTQTAGMLADALPTLSVSLNMNNINGNYSPTSTTGYYDKISKSILLKYRYGYDIVNGESVATEWLDWNFSWTTGDISFDTTTVTIQASDYLNFLTDSLEDQSFLGDYATLAKKILNLTKYPKDNDNLRLILDSDLSGYEQEYNPSVGTAKEMLQSIAYASCKQFYIDNNAYLHIDNARKNEESVYSLGLDSRLEGGTDSKTKMAKSVTVNYFTPSGATARTALTTELKGNGDAITVSSDFLYRTDNLQAVMNSILNYLNYRNVTECSFRGEPALQVLDRITFTILTDIPDESVDVIATITSIGNTYKGTLEGSITVRYAVDDIDTSGYSITGNEGFIYPAKATVPTTLSQTLVCNTPAGSYAYQWYWYSDILGAWSEISNTTNQLTIGYNDPYFNYGDNVSFKCTVDGTLSIVSTVQVTRMEIDTYTYLHILDTSPSVADSILGEYYLARTGLIYLFNGYEWVVTDDTSLIINCVVDGKTLGDISTTPLGIYIASLQGEQGEQGEAGESGEAYTVIIESSNGDVFKPNEVMTTNLKARVFNNGVEITSTLPDSAFSWRRKSFYDTSEDEAWNTAHATGYRSIDITADEVQDRATFFCDIYI